MKFTLQVNYLNWTGKAWPYIDIFHFKSEMSGWLDKVENYLFIFKLYG